MPRARRLLGLALATVLGMTACSAGGADETPSTDRDAQTRTFTDAAGSKVEAPAAPKRVVALTELDLDAALALGVTPVGTITGRGQKAPPGYLRDKAADIPIVGAVTGPTLEQVVDAEPDLILAGQLNDQGVLDQLREIAPTAVTFELGDGWKAAVDGVATALNESKAAKAWFGKYDARVAEVKRNLGDNAGAVTSIVRWSPKGPAEMKQGLFSSDVVASLGLRRPPEQAKRGAPHSAPLSLENLDQIDGDWLFVGTLSENGPDVAKMRKDTATPAFKQLQVAKQKHVVTVDGSKWTSLGGPLAAMSVLDDIDDAMGNR